MKVSVVIPAFTDQETIERTVTQLEREPNAIHEVIVVDDGSHPPLRLPGWVIPIRIDREPYQRTAGVARNLGARRATGDTLLFCDASIYFPEDAVASMIQGYEIAKITTPDEIVMLTARYIGLPDGAVWNPCDDFKDQFDAKSIPYNDEFALVNVDHQFAMIYRHDFWKLGGYDTKHFVNWGLECQDLTTRIAQVNGNVSSTVRRIKDNSRLYVVHEYHEGARDEDLREKEFVAKWGEKFSRDLIIKVLRGYVPEQQK